MFLLLYTLLDIQPHDRGEQKRDFHNHTFLRIRTKRTSTEITSN